MGRSGKLNDARQTCPAAQRGAAGEEQRGDQRSHRTTFPVTRVQALLYRPRTLKRVTSARTSASWTAPDFARASATAVAYPPSPQAKRPKTTAWLQARPSVSAAFSACASSAVGARYASGTLTLP